MNDKNYAMIVENIKSTGLYIRYGRNKTQASQEEITRMIMESRKIFYEELVSEEQELTFNTLKLKFE